MKIFFFIKLIVLTVLINTSNYNNSEAFFFKDPVEQCMDYFIDDGYSSYTAARRCRGIDKGTFACMKKLIKDDHSVSSSLRRCKPRKW